MSESSVSVPTAFEPPLEQAEPRAAAWSFSLIDLLLLGVVLIWGINFTVIKRTLVEMTPLAFNGIRFTLSTLSLLVLLRLTERDWNVIAPGDLRRLAVVGLIGHTIYQLGFIGGLSLTQAGHSSLMLGTTPIFVALLGVVLGIERVSAKTWVGILLCFAGIALVARNGGGPGASLLGDLLVLGATVCWAMYTILSKPLLVCYSPIKVTAVTMAFGTVPLVLLSVPSLIQQNWGAVSAQGWLGLLYSFSLAIVAAYVIWYTSVQRVGGTRTAVYSNLVPVVGGITGWLVLGETMGPLQIVGAAIILLGIMLTRRGGS